MKFCWLGNERSLRDILLDLGHSKQSIKRTNLQKKQLERTIRTQQEFEIPLPLFNNGLIAPLSNFSHKETPIVLEERGDILALSKPSFVHCHPLNYGEGDNILSFLRENNFTDYLRINVENYDRGLLFRLDFETSGLLLLSRNSKIYDECRKGEILKEKIYYAIVEGELNRLGTIKTRLTTKGKVVREDSDGKLVSLEIMETRSLESLPATLVKIRLNEGARHQIRVQLANCGHPIWGDRLYGAKEQDRFGLHCYSYIVGNEVFEDHSFWGLSLT